MTSAPATPHPGAFRLIAADIKLWHSVFALPFALLAAAMAGPTPGAEPKAWWRFASQLGIVVLCMVLARTWAMVINRVADRRLDADNQRTARRAFAAGAVSPVVGWSIAAACAALFVGACFLFHAFYANSWPLILSVPTLAWLAFYSFTKRFTALCHAVLGVSLAFSPIAAAIAIDPSILSRTPALWWLAGFVALWVAGFDVVYALQDEEYDRAKGLSSVPVALGTTGAIWAARGAHLLALLCLLAAWTSRDGRLGVLFAAGIGIVAGLLAVEHALLAKSAAKTGGKPGLHMVFFTLNGVASCILGAAGIADVFLA